MAERLRRQVKVSLAQIPGHESGVGSSPTLITIFFLSFFARCVDVMGVDVLLCCFAWQDLQLPSVRPAQGFNFIQIFNELL